MQPVREMAELLQTHHDRSGLDELRADVFPFIAAAVVASGWFASVGTLPSVSERTVGLPIFLSIIGYISYRCLVRSVELAAALFVGGLLFVTAGSVCLYPDTLLIFL